MKTESTLLKIKHELISMFASLDGWLDKLLDDGFDPDNDITEFEWIEHILASNYHLLQILPESYDRSLNSLENDPQSSQRSFDELRFALREQLFHSLCLIDSLDESVLHDRMDHDKQMLLHDKLVLIAQHLRYHLEEVEAQ